MSVPIEQTLAARLRGARPSASETLGRDALDRSAAAEVAARAALPSITVGDATEHEYRLLEPIGEGGMGVVHRARQRALDRDVALKSLRDGGASPTDRAALLREARLMGQLEHPGVVPVHAIGEAPGVGPVVVMKRVRGEALKDRLAALERRDEGALVAPIETLLRVCEAVEHAHRAGIVHRDLKPENVMLGDVGEVYVVDWGVAIALDEAGREDFLVGTPAYMAPEMVTDPRSVDVRSDVYLLGGILHEVLTGRPPHGGRGAVAAMVRATRPVRIEPDGLPAELVAICERACALDPTERYPRAAAVGAALRAWLAHRSAAQLAASAHVELTDARTILEGGEPDHAALLETLERVSHRFRSALELWSESPAAREGLDAVVEPMLRCQLALGNLPAARRLAERAGERLDPTLAARLEELEARRGDEERARRHVQALARERDLAVGRESRRAIMVLIVGVLTAAAVAVLASRSGNEPGRPGFLLALAVALMVPIGLSALAMRRRLFANLVNRFTTWTVLACFGGVTLHRVLALVAGHSGLTIIQHDLVLITMLIALLAIVHRGFLAVAAVGLAGAIAAYTMPTTARLVVNVVPILVAAGIYVMWRRLSFSEHTLVDRMRDDDATGPRA